ncbi:hypothetical protein [Paraburkholderia bannensis]|uniref:hypothetical protein n=1 Tax=Paraburkholderia bannensis TaxID=765414 RepID=UPI002AB78CB9|nr:hypothetical protein [Paraburkholderia bannensis]
MSSFNICGVLGACPSRHGRLDPVLWEQLRDLKNGAQWTVQTARGYLSFQTNDPWVEYWTARQSLAAAIKLLK